MKTALYAVGLIFALGQMSACSDDSSPARDAQVERPQVDLARDAAKEAQAEDGLELPSNLGEGCKKSDECKAGSPTCVTYNSATSSGVCTRSCTQDDPGTPSTDEDDCPTDFTCARLSFGTAAFLYCLKKCAPSTTKNPCPASSGQTCETTSTRFGGLSQPVCWYPACETDANCPVYSALACSEDATCKSGLKDDTAFCARERCALPGNCTAGGICAGHQRGKEGAMIGDPCASDFECPNNSRCYTNDDNWPNGYCSMVGCNSGLKEFACPTGSSCHRLYYGGLCHRSCRLDDTTSCRGHAADKRGDYDCYSWNRFTSSGIPVSDTPICALVANHDCDRAGTGRNCSAFGEAGENGTKMLCRERTTGEILAENDKSGFCMDETYSGQPAPDAGMPDASADLSESDAGTATEAGVDAGADARDGQ